MPVAFTLILLKEYQKLYRDNKGTDKKETDKIVTKLEHFIKKIRFTKWLYQIYNYSGLITGEVIAPLNYLQRLDALSLIGQILQPFLHCANVKLWLRTTPFKNTIEIMSHCGP